MFPVNKYHLSIDGLYEIKSNYSSLLNDGDNDILYTGTNKYNSRILGSIVYEDDEAGLLRYFHTIITEETFFDFLNRRISLREILKNCKSIFIIDKKYNNEIVEQNLVPLNEIPEDYLPLTNSLCPEFLKNTSLDYTFSLKGDLADLHKAEPLIMSGTNSKIFELLKAASSFLQNLDITPRIFSEVAMAGSFELNFQIQLIEKVSLFSRPKEDINHFISKFFNYIFQVLPNEPNNVIKDEIVTSPGLVKLFEEFSNIYNSRQVNLDLPASEQKVIDLITYSVDALKDIEYKGFDKIIVENKTKAGENLPVGLIPSDYYNQIREKVYKPEELEKPDEIMVDEEPKVYKIQVYSLNKESGNGGAYYVVDNKVSKVSLHLKGRKEYHGTIYTKSLDEDIPIDAKGVGKWVNGLLKELSVDVKN
jgi:hypothetical protein